MATKQETRKKGIEARRGLTHSERKEFSERIEAVVSSTVVVINLLYFIF